MGIKDRKKRRRVETSEDEAAVNHESDSDDSPINSPKVGVKSKGSKSRARNLEGDDDKPVPTVKKPRTGNIRHNVLRTAEGSSYLDLGKKKRATVSVFKGKPLIDIREYYGPEGEERPGKKGISLTLEQWEVLKEVADTIDKLVSDLKE